MRRNLANHAGVHRANWMIQFEGHVGIADRELAIYKPGDFWDSAAHAFNTGKTPGDAAKAYVESHS